MDRGRREGEREGRKGGGMNNTITFLYVVLR